MLVLFELSGGFAVFKVLNEFKLFNPMDLYEQFATTEKANRFLQLKYFVKFKTVDDAIESAICTVQSRMSPYLKEILKNHIAKEGFETLAVLDTELGYAISAELNIRCISNSNIIELSRFIRGNLDCLLGELAKDMRSMQSEVAHGLILYELNKNSKNRLK